MEPVKVLFVCMGNICRSPAAEGVFIEYVRRAGQEAIIQVDSAGTLDYHTGSLPDERMRKVAASRGYSLQSRARQVRPADLDQFDLVLAMDHTNLAELCKLDGKSRTHVRLFGSYLQDAAANGVAPAVPDPYYGGIDGFELVLDMIESACPALLEHCLAIHRERR
jgi:protein-tyrosine phosphatase